VAVTSEQLLEAMKVPSDYNGPQLEIVLRDSKMEKDATKSFVAKLLKDYLP
jgi:hypothetical protein